MIDEMDNSSGAEQYGIALWVHCFQYKMNMGKYFTRIDKNQHNHNNILQNNLWNKLYIIHNILQLML